MEAVEGGVDFPEKFMDGDFVRVEVHVVTSQPPSKRLESVGEPVIPAPECHGRKTGHPQGVGQLGKVLLGNYIQELQRIKHFLVMVDVLGRFPSIIFKALIFSQ